MHWDRKPIQDSVTVSNSDIQCSYYKQDSFLSVPLPPREWNVSLGQMVTGIHVTKCLKVGRLVIAMIFIKDRQCY